VVVVDSVVDGVLVVVSEVVVLPSN